MFRKSIIITSILIIMMLSQSLKPENKDGSGLVIEKVSEIKAKLGEGSIWDYKKQVLYWIDIEEGILFEYDPSKKTTKKHKAGKKIGTIVPETNETVILALSDGIYRMFLQNDSLEFISKPASLLSNQRFNDGKCDPSGRLWVGSMGPYQTAFLYKMNTNGEITEMVDKVTTSNGITWSIDSTKMYYIDTRSRNVRQFDYSAAEGTILNEKVIIEIPDSLGAPDGMTIDNKGKLWIAHWGGYGVYNYDPETGKLLRKIDIPAKNVTSCAFGGKDLDVLYITTASIGMSEEESNRFPDAGKLFMVKTGSRGIRTNFVKLSK